MSKIDVKKAKKGDNRKGNARKRRGMNKWENLETSPQVAEKLFEKKKEGLNIRRPKMLSPQVEKAISRKPLQRLVWSNDGRVVFFVEKFPIARGFEMKGVVERAIPENIFHLNMYNLMERLPGEDIWIVVNLDKIEICPDEYLYIQNVEIRINRKKLPGISAAILEKLAVQMNNRDMTVKSSAWTVNIEKSTITGKSTSQNVLGIIRQALQSIDIATATLAIDVLGNGAKIKVGIEEVKFKMGT